MRYSEGEIQMIVDGLAEGKMVKAIAKELGVTKPDEDSQHACIRLVQRGC